MMTKYLHIGVGQEELRTEVLRKSLHMLIAFVPLVGAIVLLVLMVQDSDPGQNQYGMNPKEATI